ncbi:MAG: hypothetical protein ACYTGR_06545 [Planctomycetota bacterium]|jgi:pyruvate-ferredoxin/flavodoxin oxidoreductase
MTTFAARSWRYMQRLLRGADERAEAVGPASILDGLAAVVRVETALCETAGLGASFPAAIAGRSWLGAVERGGSNIFGRSLSAVQGDGARAALSGAMGAAMAGERATVFLSGTDLLAVQDLLGAAAGQHLPLVMHVAGRAAPRHGQAIGTGHESIHLSSDSGWFQLFATNVQEAVDLTLVARRVAEATLVPGMVIMDGEQTALSAQDLVFPERGVLRDAVGDPADLVDPLNDAQRMLFGERRRRIPCPFSVDRPALALPFHGPETYALGAAGWRPYFGSELAAAMAAAVEHVASLTGRPLTSTVRCGGRRPGVLLVAEGAAVETICAFADHATAHGESIAALGIRGLRPFPMDEIARGAASARVVAVLERMDAPLAMEGPLARQVRLALASGSAKGEAPRIVSVPYGIGGLPLDVADLAALVERLPSSDEPLLYLGLEFVRDTSAFPKQQALLDALRRSDDRLASLGVRGVAPPPDVRPPDAMTVTIHRQPGAAEEAFAADAAALLHAGLGGHLRTRPGTTWERCDRPSRDRIILAPTPLRDPGDDAPVDIAVIAAERLDPRESFTVVPGGAVLIAGECGTEPMGHVIPTNIAEALAAAEASFHAVDAPALDALDARTARHEAMLGGLLRLAAARRGDDTLTATAARALRESALEHVSEPERSHRLDAFVSGLESLRPIATGDAAESGQPLHAQPVAPPVTTDGADAALVEAWNHTGLFLQTGRTRELTAHPYLAAGGLPTATATLRDVSGARSFLASFDPATCDGDPGLWTTCPDGSVVPLVIASSALIGRGIELAGAAGRPADALRSIAGKLAKRVNRLMAGASTPPENVGALLREALGEVLASTKVADERRASLHAALDAVVEAVGALRVCTTPVFFDEPEARAPGTGELFALVVNPETCKCPELLLARFEGRGLRRVPRNDETLEEARAGIRLWQRLPDTAGATIELARAHAEVGPLAAIMLSRHCLHAMAGGDAAEPGSGAKLALRHVLGLAEFHLQPRLQAFLAEIDAERGRLDQRIHELLAEGLPTGDLDALAAGLVAADPEGGLAALTARVDAAATEGHIDHPRVAALVDAARALGRLRWQIAEGPTGRGRARYGLVIAGAGVGSWAGVFPNNPFHGPTALDACNEAGGLAAGVVEGQARQVLDGFRLLRSARFLLDDRATTPPPGSLDWEDLTEHERMLFPPVLLVGDGRAFGRRASGSVARLLRGGPPVKVVALSGFGGTADDGLAIDALDDQPTAERFDLGLLALLERDAFVVQSSIGAPRHFAEGVLQALTFDGPAFMHLHAPSPERHGFERTCLLEHAALAIASRSVPLFSFDPNQEGVFGTRLDISANPSSTARWSHDEDGVPITPAAWCAGQRRYDSHLAPVGGGHGAPMPVADYLDAPAAERAGRTAVVETADGGRAVDTALMTDIEKRMGYWQTLQELAGAVTPFTAAVRETLEREVAATHAAEITRLERDHAEQLARLRGAFEDEAAERVTRGLLDLAGFAPAGRFDGGETP